jgi:UDP-glucose 4-epimerase
LSPWRHTRVAVTGGTGFIGRHLVRALSREGANPVLLTRSSEAPPERCRTRYLDLAADDSASLRTIFREEAPDVLFHLAGVRGRTESPAETLRVNLTGSLHLLEALVGSGVRRVVLVGSAAEYGAQEGPWNEELPLLATGAYGLSKAAVTHAAAAFHRACGVPVVVIRPFTVYGPGLSPELFVGEAVGHAVRGSPLRMSPGVHRQDLIFVADVVRAILLAGLASNAEGTAINVGSGASVQLKDVASRIWEISGTSAPLLLGALPLPTHPVYDGAADITRAARLLGWKPEVDLTAGLRQTIDWAREAFACGLS